MLDDGWVGEKLNKKQKWIVNRALSGALRDMSIEERKMGFWLMWCRLLWGGGGYGM